MKAASQQYVWFLRDYHVELEFVIQSMLHFGYDNFLAFLFVV